MLFLSFGAGAAAAHPTRVSLAFRYASVSLGGGQFLGSDGVTMQQTWYDCGPAALVNLLHLLGVHSPTVEAVSRRAGTTTSGTTLGALRRVAGEHGVQLAATRLDPYRVSAASPFIAWVDRGHFVVVSASRTTGYVVVIDPRLGRYRIPARSFARRWSGEALVLLEPPPGGRGGESDAQQQLPASAHT